MSTAAAETERDMRVTKVPNTAALRMKIATIQANREQRVKDIEVACKALCTKIDETHREAAKAEKAEVREKSIVDKEQVKKSANVAISRWNGVITTQEEVARREREAEELAAAEATVNPEEK